MVAHKRRKSNAPRSRGDALRVRRVGGSSFASKTRMLTQQQKRMLAFSAVGVGAFAAAQMWRRRDPYEFAGKSVLITGGSRGLGLVIARQIAEEGARLTLVARDEAELTRAMQDIQTRYPFADVAPV